jgi:hypothetical protein
MYNNRQMDIAHLDALDKYRPYVTSEDPAERLFGYRAYVDLGEEELVVELITAKKDGAGIVVAVDLARAGKGEVAQRAGNAVDIIMAAGVSIEQELDLQPSYHPSVPGFTPEEGEGWAYLGHYVAGRNEWKTRYFDFNIDTDPQELEGKSITVRERTGALNVRAGMPTPEGAFRKVVDVLHPGTRANVHEVQEWQSTGYTWARITYDT